MRKKVRFALSTVAVVSLAAVTAAPAMADSGRHTNYTHPNVAIKNLSRMSIQTTNISGAHGAVPTNYGWSASNWSGYAVSGSGYNQVSGQWTVPAVKASSKSTYSSSWIGIDGFNNSDLIQTGTEQDYTSGSARYDAWWEILPAAETVIPSMVVRPGDKMTADIVNQGNGQWKITLNDVTENESFTTTQSYSGPGTSAEWIQEAPQVGGRIATLANYGSTTFDPGTVNNANPGLTANDGGDMVQNRVVVSSPSLPDRDTDGFNVAYGSTAPGAPAS